MAVSSTEAISTVTPEPPALVEPPFTAETRAPAEPPTPPAVPALVHPLDSPMSRITTSSCPSPPSVLSSPPLSNRTIAPHTGRVSASCERKEREERDLLDPYQPRARRQRTNRF